MNTLARMVRCAVLLVFVVGILALIAQDMYRQPGPAVAASGQR
jgi:hypothetical protein